MSNKKDINEIFYKTWEPKSSHRFMVYLTDEKTKKGIIPCFLIKHIDRPRFIYGQGKRNWLPIYIDVYETIEPPNVLFHLLKATVFTVTVNELGPVGDTIETWVLPLCKFQSVMPTSLDWSTESGTIGIIKAEIDWSEIIVKDGDSEFKITK